MPLLKKKPFEKASLPENLRDDEEVFYCAVTNEIFRSYEDFSERMFLCNSMVWTCSMTGKTNLTFSEAVESEENARKSIRDFPMELKIPILYLASRTRRTGFAEMADDVFLYARDRYFVGENVEASFTDTKWKDSHVLQVIGPKENHKSPRKNGSSKEHHEHPPASLYKYEIEHLDANDEDVSEIMIVDSNHIKRKKGSFSRDRCKLFLKQYVEQDSRGIFIVKRSTIEDFKINKIDFKQIFDGPPPEFDASKKFISKVVNGKKTRQESLHKFLTKNNPDMVKNGSKDKDSNKDVKDNKKNSDLLEKMRLRQEEFKKMKEKKKQEKQAMKQKLKEEQIVLSKYLKDWYKPKEDLELIDHKKLPVPSPVNIKIPEQYLGDVLMVLEFVHSFSKILLTKDFFPGGLTLELMERALTKNEVAGPYIDLVQMLLNALFNVQEEEARQYKTQLENPSSIKQEDATCPPDMNYREATRLATIASTWSAKFQGLPLGRLPLYSLTTSEVLRLHLLSSGALITCTGARWRYQQRGGYTSEDDPGLYLRLHRPDILRALMVRNVVELSIADKLEIVSCLMNQLLTYADVRDVVEEKNEKIRQAKSDHKSLLVAERKRQQEFVATKTKMKRAGWTPAQPEDLKKLEAEEARSKEKNEVKMEQLRKAAWEKQVLLGQDRAYRQFLRLESLPGLFVNSEIENRGTCFANVVKQYPNLANANHTEITEHIKKMLRETSKSPQKSPQKANGINNSLLQEPEETMEDLLLCSADATSCVVHSSETQRPKWCFYHEQEKFDDLLNCLNKRGIRESELKQNLDYCKDELYRIIKKTPVNSLNSDFTLKDNEEIIDNKRSKKTYRPRYEDANLGYSVDMNPEEILHNVLVDNILELEEKIFVGNLGKLKVKDREKWRSCLQDKNYKELDKTLKLDNSNENKSEQSDESDTATNNNSEVHDYNDPSQILNCLPSVSNEAKVEMYTQKEEIREAVKSLAVALAQISHSVEFKFLKRPLGAAVVSKSDIKMRDRLSNWQKSLLVSTSFSQIFLHYSTLESCVMWSKSALLARCRICRRQSDSENMLLCDMCNMGHHLYCLKPKLRSMPAGEWYCYKCVKEKNVENAPVQEEPPPPKKRPIFRDEEIEEEQEEESVDEEQEEEVEEEEESDEENGVVEEEAEPEEDEDEEESNEEDAEDSEGSNVKIELCNTCGSGGELICCDTCDNYFHIECVDPPLRRPPRGPWTCMSCKQQAGRKRRYDKNYSKGAVEQRTGIMNGQRRCAAKALYKIHDFAKSLRQLSDSDDSSDDEVVYKRATRADGLRSDLPLHNAALHEVLTEIMKDYNAWPFLRPVQKTEVPDYYDVITKPMDFGTIKYKLNMGEYHEDAQFMSDALLVFQNCNTYNHTEDDVYKCGVQLLKHFQRKCRELGLKLPEEMDYNSVIPKKKIRTK